VTPRDGGFTVFLLRIGGESVGVVVGHGGRKREA
jgi:hypothetical protein